MKNAKLIGDIGRLVLILGSAMYVLELLWVETTAMTVAISCVYAVALVLMFIGWIGTRDERRAAKEAARAEKENKEAA